MEEKKEGEKQRERWQEKKENENGNSGERIVEIMGNCVGINYGFGTVARSDIFGRELKQPQHDTWS